jgi:predicted DNA-binding transcriptional regulator AlpA
VKKPAEKPSPTKRQYKVPPPRAPMHRVADFHPGDEPPQPTRYIFKAEVIKLVGFTHPTLWRWMREDPPAFPMSFDIGGKTAWRQDEVEAWLASRPRSNLKKREG